MRSCRLLGRLRVLASLTLIAMASGCYPGIAWLPDSSGFVYTGGKDGKQLLLYDLKKKVSRVVVADVGGPAWPMVSSDGKQIAVVHSKSVGSEVSLAVTVFDREGKRVHRSEGLPWGKVNKEKDSVRHLPWGIWVPDSDKLVIYSARRTGFYDLTDKKVTTVPGALLPFAGGPAVPGRKGVLTLTTKRAFLVGWDGKQREMKVTPSDDGRDECPFPTNNYHVLPCIWDGPALNCPIFFPSEDDIYKHLRIDTAKLTATQQRNRSLEKGSDMPPRYSHSFPGGVAVRVVSPASIMPTPRSGDGKYRLEAVRPGAKAPEVLDERLEREIMISPSPDRKWLVVGWIGKKLDWGDLPPRPADCHLLIVNSDGKIVGRLDGAK